MKLPLLSRYRDTSRFLLIFFAPVAGAILLVFAYGYFSIERIRSIQKLESRNERGVLRRAAEISQISFGLLGLQRTMADSLQRAKSRTIDELSAYRQHGAIVNKLANISSQINNLSSSVQTLSSSGVVAASMAAESEQLKVQFDQYLRHTLQASDIVAVDPVQAERYMAQSIEEYYAIAQKLQAIDIKLSEEALGNLDKMEIELEALAGRGLKTVFVISVVGTVLWFFIALFLSSRLSLLARALNRLASEGGVSGSHSDIDEVNRLGLQRADIVGEMARGVLAFRDTCKERDAVQRTLEKERQNFEQTVEQRIAQLMKDARGKN